MTAVTPQTTPGDSGETDLRAGGHASKDDVRIDTYGTLDELTSALGLARALRPPEELDATLDHLQRDLFDLGAELSLPPGAAPAPAPREPRVDAARTAALEAEIVRLQAALPPLHTFILPGGTPAAALHLARAICRRAERHAVALAHADPAGVRPEVVRYLNRLSDLLFALARAANQQAGLPDAPWRPGPATPA